MRDFLFILQHAYGEFEKWVYNARCPKIHQRVNKLIVYRFINYFIPSAISENIIFFLFCRVTTSTRKYIILIWFYCYCYYYYYGACAIRVIYCELWFSRVLKSSQNRSRIGDKSSRARAPRRLNDMSRTIGTNVIFSDACPCVHVLLAFRNLPTTTTTTVCP